MNSSKNYNIDLSLFKINDIILLFNNFYIKNKSNKLKILDKSRIKVKNSMYNICGEVVGILGSGNYNIIISKDYPLYNLDKFDYCQVNNSLLKKVDIDIWKKILSK